MSRNDRARNKRYWTALVSPARVRRYCHLLGSARVMRTTQHWVAFLCGVVVAAAACAEESPAGAARAQLWSYQPVRSQAAPAVHDAKWVRTPIDAFVLAKLQEKGLQPSPEASRAAFARRATLDTLGVIPEPEAVRAFVSDRS